MRWLKGSIFLLALCALADDRSHKSAPARPTVNDVTRPVPEFDIDEQDAKSFQLLWKNTREQLFLDHGTGESSLPAKPFPLRAREINIQK